MTRESVNTSSSALRSSNLRVEWVGDPARFAALAPHWDALASRAETPFMGHAWLSTWWSAFGADRRLAVCVLWAGSELAAALPLLAHRRRLVAMANEHTPLFHPLAQGPVELSTLAEAVLGGDRELELCFLPASGPGLSALVNASRAAGRLTRTERHATSPLTDTRGEFSAYRAQRKGRWRELERRGRKLSREHRVEMQLIEAPGDLEAELEAGLRLEAAGWKGSAGTAILGSPATTRFYRAVGHAFHERGQLRLSALRVDGRLAAFDLAILCAGRYFLLKTAYDESMRTLGPGLVLRVAVVERCFELGLAAHEFLGDDMAWKRLFSTGERPLCRHRAYPRRPLPVARYAYGRFMRPRLKRAYHALAARRT